MEKESVLKASNTALKKYQLLKQAPCHYFIRAMLAGIYIGFAVVLSFTVAQPFFEHHSSATYLVNAIFFGIAFTIIIYGGGELFTSNTMYMTIGSLRKEVSWFNTVKLWVSCYGGNLLGISIFVSLIYFAGLFQQLGTDYLLMHTVEKKMALPTTELFFRAVLCNWLVCLAIWIPMQTKEDTSKILIMMLIVFAFFISGYEHSIANLALFTIALVSPHPETISFAGFIHNIIPVTLGNIIGGGFFVGATYAFLTKEKKLHSPPLELPQQKNYKAN